MWCKYRAEERGGPGAGGRFLTIQPLAGKQTGSSDGKPAPALSRVFPVAGWLTLGRGSSSGQGLGEACVRGGVTHDGQKGQTASVRAHGCLTLGPVVVKELGETRRLTSLKMREFPSPVPRRLPA